MAWYAVYDANNGNALVSIGQTVATDAELQAKGLAVAGPFTYDPRQEGYSWNPTTLTFSYMTPVKPRRIPTLDFMDRFTDTEFAAIVNARDSGTDPQVSLTLKVFFERLNAAPEVNLDSQRVIDGLAYLEQQGLIAQGRAAEIRA